MVDTSQGPEEFESSFPVCSEMWASVSSVIPEDTGWYHVARTMSHYLFPLELGFGQTET